MLENSDYFISANWWDTNIRSTKLTETVKINQRSGVRFPYGSSGMKKGGSVKKKKQGYKDRKDESIAMRIRKKRTPAQLKASRDESYGKFGSKSKKSGKINR